MMPGPTLIRTCSVCSGHITEPTLQSGNNFGAIHWSDGFMDAPMLLGQSLVVKCPHCKVVLWLDEQKIIAEVRSIYIDEYQLIKAVQYQEADFNDYMKLLASVRADSTENVEEEMDDISLDDLEWSTQPMGLVSKTLPSHSRLVGRKCSKKE